MQGRTSHQDTPSLSLKIVNFIPLHTSTIIPMTLYIDASAFSDAPDFVEESKQHFLLSRIILELAYLPEIATLLALDLTEKAKRTAYLFKINDHMNGHYSLILTDSSGSNIIPLDLFLPTFISDEKKEHAENITIETIGTLDLPDQFNSSEHFQQLRLSIAKEFKEKQQMKINEVFLANHASDTKVPQLVSLSQKDYEIATAATIFPTLNSYQTILKKQLNTLEKLQLPMETCPHIQPLIEEENKKFLPYLDAIKTQLLQETIHHTHIASLVMIYQNQMAQVRHLKQLLIWALYHAAGAYFSTLEQNSHLKKDAKIHQFNHYFSDFILLDKEANVGNLDTLYDIFEKKTFHEIQILINTILSKFNTSLIIYSKALSAFKKKLLEINAHTDQKIKIKSKKLYLPLKILQLETSKDEIYLDTAKEIEVEQLKIIDKNQSALLQASDIRKKILSKIEDLKALFQFKHQIQTFHTNIATITNEINQLNSLSQQSAQMSRFETETNMLDERYQFSLKEVILSDDETERAQQLIEFEKIVALFQMAYETKQHSLTHLQSLQKQKKLFELGKLINDSLVTLQLSPSQIQTLEALISQSKCRDLDLDLALNYHSYNTNIQRLRSIHLKELSLDDIDKTKIEIEKTLKNLGTDFNLIIEHLTIQILENDKPFKDDEENSEEKAFPFFSTQKAGNLRGKIGGAGLITGLLIGAGVGTVIGLFIAPLTLAVSLVVCIIIGMMIGAVLGSGFGMSIGQAADHYKSEHIPVNHFALQPLPLKESASQKSSPTLNLTPNRKKKKSRLATIDEPNPTEVNVCVSEKEEFELYHLQMEMNLSLDQGQRRGHE